MKHRVIQWATGGVGRAAIQVGFRPGTGLPVAAAQAAAQAAPVEEFPAVPRAA